MAKTSSPDRISPTRTVPDNAGCDENSLVIDSSSQKRGVSSSFRSGVNFSFRPTSLMPGVQVAAVARKHGATRWQIYYWRRRLRRGQLALPESMALMFAPLMVEGSSAPQRAMRPPKSAPAKVEIVIDDMVIRTAVDLEHLTQLIRAVRPRDDCTRCRSEYLHGDPSGRLSPRPRWAGSCGAGDTRPRPFCGAAFVFRAKRADRIKILDWDRTGLVLVRRGNQRESAATIWMRILCRGGGDDRGIVRRLDWRLVRPEGAHGVRSLPDIVDQKIDAAAPADNLRQPLAADRLARGKNRRLDAMHPFGVATRK